MLIWVFNERFVIEVTAYINTEYLHCMEFDN